MTNPSSLPVLIRIQIGVAVVAAVVTLGAAIELSSLVKTRSQLEAEIKTRKVEADSIIALLGRSSDSAQHRLDSLKAATAAVQDSLAATLGRVAGAESAQYALRRASAKLRAPTKQPSQSQAGDTLETIQKVVPFTGGLSPGSSVVVYIRLPYRASLTYRRWISQEKVDTLGIVGPANLELHLPYGGYIYFEAKNASTGDVASRAADCRRGWCNVSF